MYDILQLNDMLVPELLDIAEQLKIPNAKKLDKQALVYQILDKQAVAASAAKGGTDQAIPLPFIEGALAVLGQLAIVFNLIYCITVLLFFY